LHFELSSKLSTVAAVMSLDQPQLSRGGSEKAKQAVIDERSLRLFYVYYLSLSLSIVVNAIPLIGWIDK